MKITVIRGASSDTGTPGDLSIDGNDFKCKTLELPWRDNQTGISCIMPDTYTCWRFFSPHLGDVLRLEDKHGRSACEVHPGNFAGDAAKGMETQVHGCTLVGTGYEEINRLDGQGTQLGIVESRKAIAQLIAVLSEGTHTITYQWAEGCEP